MRSCTVRNKRSPIGSNSPPNRGLKTYLPTFISQYQIRENLSRDLSQPDLNWVSLIPLDFIFKGRWRGSIMLSTFITHNEPLWVCLGNFQVAAKLLF